MATDAKPYSVRDRVIVTMPTGAERPGCVVRTHDDPERPATVLLDDESGRVTPPLDRIRIDR